VLRPQGPSSDSCNVSVRTLTCGCQQPGSSVAVPSSDHSDTMAILQSCCCWRSLRTGSYASALYTAVSRLAPRAGAHRRHIPSRRRAARFSAVLTGLGIPRNNSGSNFIVFQCGGLHEGHAVATWNLRTISTKIHLNKAETE
jgi:hypothetical protein